MDLSGFSLKIYNYKCFGLESVGYEQFALVNLIIGRNNVGKSSLLDLVDYATAPRDIPAALLNSRTAPVRVMLGAGVTQQSVEAAYPSQSSGGDLSSYRSWFEYGKQFIGGRIMVDLLKNKQFVEMDPMPGIRIPRAEARLGQTVPNPFETQKFRRLRADRDVRAEPESGSLKIESDGVGFTNLVQSYINNQTLSSEVVETLFLNELNAIYQPDVTFSRIVTERIAGGVWEVALEELGKPRVPLSQSGSGLKTVLLTLGLIHLLPKVEGFPLDSYLFGIEEPENNLHPAIIRRLLSYVRDVAVKNGCHFFITTHSHAAIDVLARDNDAQIIHVTHAKGVSTVRRVTTYIDNCGILDDLDVRASDLLQANGVVWVEGPSDRLYLKRWIDLITGGTLKEGVHYQCVFYGGRLLAHLSSSEPAGSSGVPILRVNRNAIVLIDSDRKSADDAINATKRRILAEIEGVGGLGWITAGRTIENYLPSSPIAAVQGWGSVRSVERYEEFSGYLDEIEGGAGKRFLKEKVVFAEKTMVASEPADLDVLDLKEKIRMVCDRIKQWNGLN